MITYTVTRRYFNEEREPEIMLSGVSLQEAQEHCRSIETSSRTCTLPDNIRHTDKWGPWFDSFESE